MVGDSVADVEAGNKAGCVSVYLGKEHTNSDYKFNSLKEFSEFIFNQHNNSD